MKIIKTISELKENRMSSKSFPLGLVPTMGALHEGHLSLAHSAIAACPEIIVSIFVNPTQFNDKNDLEKYPRTMEKDKDLLGTVLRKNDIIFAPEVHEIYPEEDKRKFSFGNLDNVMEALHRPGHFNGVAQIVSKLFSITEPDIAFFGMKDFQQLAVIKDLVRQMNSRIQIVSCPIIRENDGLAMSSRNALLEKHVREKAPVIFKTISEAAGMITSKDIPEIREFVAHKINSIRDFNVEYFEIADDVELIPVNAKRNMIPGRKYYCCIAVKAGKIRLIDNIEISVKM
ncbi:MAG TPA: pantoate--beta-alanine ligase [Bacteroidales bacterium]|jgi:pantoate--beta-alanine ligase|nr:pantoate--beta-alanine ligase [Bacteroidales bacterium]